MDLPVKNVCIRCSHTWKPHAGKKISKVCPRCKSPYWNAQKCKEAFFDPAIHTKAHDDFSRLLGIVRNRTHLAHSLGIEYPKLIRLIRMNNNYKPLPADIVERVDEWFYRNKEVARKIGIPVQELQAYLSGEKTPTQELIDHMKTNQS